MLPFKQGNLQFVLRPTNYLPTLPGESLCPEPLPSMIQAPGAVGSL